MQFGGRRIILTTLAPLPRSMRAVPGILAINNLEAEALKNGDGDVFKELIEICKAEDMADANRTWIVKPRKVTAKTAKLAPSHRLAMIHANRAGKV